MRHTLRILTLLLLALAGAGQAWALRGSYPISKGTISGGDIAFYENAEMSTASIDNAAPGSTVYIQATPDVFHSCLDVEFTAQKSAPSSQAEARTRAPKYGTIEVSAVTGKPGLYSFVMPSDDSNVTVSATFPDKANETKVEYLTWSDTDKKLEKTTTADNTKVYVLDGTETTLGKTGEETWYVCSTAATENDGKGLAYAGELKLYGNVHLILADKAAMTCSCLRKYSSEDNLTIYGQSTGDDMGKLTATKADGCIYVHNLAINGGEVTTNATSIIGYSILADNVTINGGKVNAISDYVGIWATKDFTISGGKVKAEGYKGIFAQNTVSITGGTVEAIGKEVGIWATNDFTISGGQVKATSSPPPNTAGICSDVGNIHLGYTNADDYIFATSYGLHSPNTLSVGANDGQRFVAYNPVGEGETELAASCIVSGTAGTDFAVSDIDGKTLRPLDGYVVSASYSIPVKCKTDADGKDKPDFTIYQENVSNTRYYIFKKDATVTAASTGHEGDYIELAGLPDGVQTTEQALDHSFTMPDEDVTITGVKYYNLEVEYMDWENGIPEVATTDAGKRIYVLDGSVTRLGVENEDNWYIAKGSVDFSSTVSCVGNVHLILADGAVMKIGSEDFSDNGIVGANLNSSLFLYGQREGTGTLSILGNENLYGINSIKDFKMYSCKLNIPLCYFGLYLAGESRIYGSEVKMPDVRAYGIYTQHADVLLKASSLYINSTAEGISSKELCFYSGQVDIIGNGVFGDVNLSWATTSDYFKASKYIGKVTIDDVHCFTYEGYTGEPLTGTFTWPQTKKLDGQKLVPALKVEASGETYVAYSSGNGNWVLNDPNAQVYVITGYDLETGVVYLTPVAGNEIPDGVPVIIGNKTDGSALPDNLVIAGEQQLSVDAAGSITGALKYFVAGDGQTTLQKLIDGITGSTGTPASDYVAFILDDGRFKPILMNASATPSNGACLLILPKVALLTQAVVGGSTSAARTLTIDLGGDATGIEENARCTMHNAQSDGEWYDLQGRRLSGQPTQKGVYIHNGRAVVIK